MNLKKKRKKYESESIFFLILKIFKSFDHRYKLDLFLLNYSMFKLLNKHTYCLYNKIRLFLGKKSDSFL